MNRPRLRSYSALMDGLIAVALTFALVAPLHWVILRSFDRLDSAAYLRESGVVILDQRALDMCGDIIGSFSGAPIYGWLVFKGMVYEFNRPVRPAYRKRIGRDELYLDPGLLYLVAQPRSPFATG